MRIYFTFSLPGVVQVEGDDVGRDLGVGHDDADVRVGREHVDEGRETGVAHLHELIIEE